MLWMNKTHANRCLLLLNPFAPRPTSTLLFFCLERQTLSTAALGRLNSTTTTCLAPSFVSLCACAMPGFVLLVSAPNNKNVFSHLECHRAAVYSGFARPQEFSSSTSVDECLGNNRFRKRRREKKKEKELVSDQRQDAAAKEFEIFSFSPSLCLSLELARARTGEGRSSNICFSPTTSTVMLTRENKRERERREKEKAVRRRRRRRTAYGDVMSRQNVFSLSLSLFRFFSRCVQRKKQSS